MMPPVRSTKAGIVEEAAGLFADRGFAAVGVQEIAEKVGISGGAIYRHFPSKDAVLDAVLLDSITGWLNAAEVGRTADTADPAAPIRQMVTASLQLVVDNPGQLATYLRERHRADGATRQRLNELERALFMRWRDAMVAARPTLSPDEVVVRQLAVNGVLSALARRASRHTRRGSPTVVTDGLVGLLSLAPLPSRADQPPQQPWRPPVSRRDQILTAAVRLFAERGYHGVSIDDIGVALGMSGPSLYEHFDSKADILLDAYDRASALTLAGASLALASARSASDGLVRLVRSFVSVAFDHAELFVVTIREGASLAPSEQPRIHRRRRDLIEQWTAVLREVRPDLSPAESRTLVRSTFDMVAALARHRRADSPSVDATAAYVLAFLDPKESS